MSPARKERADALRNRETVLTAADRLFAERSDPDEVSMSDIATAAGVGKGTLFRRFGDRVGLVRALVERRTEALRDDLLTGPEPLGPDTPAAQRVPALLDALLRLKLEARPLMLALERAGSASPYQNETYTLWHTQLTAMLSQARRAGEAATGEAATGEAATGEEPDSDFLAHALLAALRSDLIEHLIRSGTPRQRIHDGLASLARAILAGDTAA